MSGISASEHQSRSLPRLVNLVCLWVSEIAPSIVAHSLYCIPRLVYHGHDASEIVTEYVIESPFVILPDIHRRGVVVIPSQIKSLLGG